MNRYRILEKKGCTVQWDNSKLSGDVNDKGETYIPRFIVQKFTILPGSGNILDITGCCDKIGWDSLEEFTLLQKARDYKNALELDDGKVIE